MRVGFLVRTCRPILALLLDLALGLFMNGAATRPILDLRVEDVGAGPSTQARRSNVLWGLREQLEDIAKHILDEV